MSSSRGLTHGLSSQTLGRQGFRLAKKHTCCTIGRYQKAATCAADLARGLSSRFLVYTQFRLESTPNLLHCLRHEEAGLRVQQPRLGARVEQPGVGAERKGAVHRTGVRQRGLVMRLAPRHVMVPHVQLLAAATRGIAFRFG